jgi:hypothetical protein
MIWAGKYGFLKRMCSGILRTVFLYVVLPQGVGVSQTSSRKDGLGVQTASAWSKRYKYSLRDVQQRLVQAAACCLIENTLLLPLQGLA